MIGKAGVNAMNDATELSVFLEIKARIDALLIRLQAMSADSFGINTDEVSKDHIVSLVYVEEALAETVLFCPTTRERK
jgi:hypothetical protein